MFSLLTFEFTNYVNCKIYNLISANKMLNSKNIFRYIFALYLVVLSTIFLISTFIFEFLRISNADLIQYINIIKVIVIIYIFILPFTKISKIYNQLNRDELYSSFLFNTNISFKGYIFIRVLIHSIFLLTLTGLSVIAILFSMQISLGYGVGYLLSFLIKYFIYCIYFLQLRMILISYRIIAGKYNAIFNFCIICISLILIIFKNINIQLLKLSINNLIALISSNYLLVLLVLTVFNFILLNKSEVSLKQKVLEYKNKNKLAKKIYLLKERNSLFKIILLKEITSLIRHKELKNILFKLILPLIIINFFIVIIFNINLDINIIIMGSIMLYTTILVSAFRKYLFISSEKFCIKYIIFSNVVINKFVYNKIIIYLIIINFLILTPINVFLILSKSILDYMYCNIWGISYISTVVCIEYFSDAIFPNFNKEQYSNDKINSKGNLIAQIILSIYIWLTISVNSIFGILNYRGILLKKGFVLSTSLINLIIASIFIYIMIFYYKRKEKTYWIL